MYGPCWNLARGLRQLPVSCALRGNDRAILKAVPVTVSMLFWRRGLLPTASQSPIELYHRLQFDKPKLCQRELSAK
jgi:hypothetical protein